MDHINIYIFRERYVMVSLITGLKLTFTSLELPTRGAIFDTTSSSKVTGNCYTWQNPSPLLSPKVGWCEWRGCHSLHSCA